MQRLLRLEKIHAMIIGIPHPGNLNPAEDCSRPRLYH